jgi:ATP:ADP antiporter, AAA family
MSQPHGEKKAWLDRALSLFTEVRAGEGATACLMLVNVFLLLICYSVIKTAREPLILLGGGAEVRSYAAAGQAVMLMGFVPLYSWFARHVNRVKLLVGVYLFFLLNIELFAVAVAAGVPYVGVAFYIWVGIFNMSLVAQFWAYANDIYSMDAANRLFPMIVVGQTAGAPFGAFIAGRLFRAHIPAPAILQISAVLLVVAILVFLVVNSSVKRRVRDDAQPLSGGNGFALVWRNPYLRAIAVMMILLNAVNTTGEYFVSHLVVSHARAMAAADPGFDAQAYIGFFYGDYQFWVNVVAFLLQAFVASRLVKYDRLRGVLLVLPLIALSGYAVIAAGASFALVRWIKTAENATDYSIMNTARQLLWLPTSTDEKYKAKQAIDAFFVRSGDVLSAAIVFTGTAVLHLSIGRFALVNVALTVTWLGIALLVLRRHDALLERRAQAA